VALGVSRRRKTPIAARVKIRQIRTNHLSIRSPSCHDSSWSFTAGCTLSVQELRQSSIRLRAQERRETLYTTLPSVHLHLTLSRYHELHSNGTATLADRSRNLRRNLEADRGVGGRADANPG
jgi:hypothetical protein